MYPVAHWASRRNWRMIVNARTAAVPVRFEAVRLLERRAATASIALSWMLKKKRLLLRAPNEERLLTGVRCAGPFVDMSSRIDATNALACPTLATADVNSTSTSTLAASAVAEAVAPSVAAAVADMKLPPTHASSTGQR